MLPQFHWTLGMVRNTWPYQVSILLWFQTSVQNFPTLWACWCKPTKGICLNSSCIVCSLWFVEFFHCVLLDILYLTDTAKFPFIMGLIFFICLSFDIFHLAVFCHINICIVKQTYINLSVCSLHTCEIDYLIMGLCVRRHALICKYHVSLFLSPFLFIDYLW